MESTNRLSVKVENEEAVLSLRKQLDAKSSSTKAAEQLRSVQEVLVGFMPEVKRVRRNDSPLWFSREDAPTHRRKQR